MTPLPCPGKRGVYIASKTKHADRWRFLRDTVGEPIISTRIDEAGAGESGDLDDLWRRCILEASTAEVLILYREPDDVLKGGWVELGAALASGVTVFAVGIEEFTIAHDKRIRHFPNMKAAIAAARQLRASPAPQPLHDVPCLINPEPESPLIHAADDAFDGSRRLAAQYMDALIAILLEEDAAVIHRIADRALGSQPRARKAAEG